MRTLTTNKFNRNPIQKKMNPTKIDRNLIKFVGALLKQMGQLYGILETTIGILYLNP